MKKRLLPVWAVATGLLAAGYSCALRSLDEAMTGPPLAVSSERRLLENPPGDAPVVLLIGDSGAASPEFRTNVDAMSRERADLALHLGDVSYHGPSEYGRFLENVSALPFPLFTVPGDHDRDWDPTLAAYDRLLGGRNRVVNAGALRVVLLDGSSEDLSEDDFSFLESALDETPPPKWTIVATHCPPYQPGLPFPASLGTGHAIRDASAARRLLEVCRTHRVSLLAAGHLHEFHEADEGGVPLVVSGGGGRSVEPGEWFHYVRVTFTDPISIEPVFTTPGTGRAPLARLGDSAIARLLRSGPWLTAGFVGILLLLLVVDRERSVWRYRHLVAGLPLGVALASMRLEWENNAILWPLAVALVVLGIALRAAASGGSGRSIFRRPDYWGGQCVLAGAIVASELAWLLPVAIPWAALVYAVALRQEPEGPSPHPPPVRPALLGSAAWILVLVPFVMKELNVFGLWPHG